MFEIATMGTRRKIPVIKAMEILAILATVDEILIAYGRPSKRSVWFPATPGVLFSYIGFGLL